VTDLNRSPESQPTTSASAQRGRRGQRVAQITGVTTGLQRTVGPRKSVQRVAESDLAAAESDGAVCLPCALGRECDLATSTDCAGERVAGTLHLATSKDW
jgi:hypothetical protein